MSCLNFRFLVELNAVPLQGPRGIDDCNTGQYEAGAQYTTLYSIVYHPHTHTV